MPSRVTEKVNFDHKDVRIPGETGSEQNALRGDLYAEAFRRINEGLENESYWEVILLVDSIIADRALALTQTFIHDEVEQYQFMGVGMAIEALRNTAKSKDYKFSKDYRGLLNKINLWVSNRNKAVHGFVAVTPETFDNKIEDRIELAFNCAQGGALLARSMCSETAKIISELKSV